HKFVLILLVITAASASVSVLTQIVIRTTTRNQHSTIWPVVAKQAPSLTDTCLSHAVVAKVEPAQAGDSLRVTNPNEIFSTDTLSHLGNNLRFAAVQDLRSTATPGIPIEVGGSYQGHPSCDYTFADHPAAAALA